MNPVRNSTYEALWALLREAAAAFPDTYVHLGGDEVPFDCWQVGGMHAHSAMFRHDMK
jgi:hexosaminidase